MGRLRKMMVEEICPMLTPIEGTPCKHYIRDEKGKPGFCSQGTRFHCTEAMKKFLPAFSYSSLTDFISCKLKYYYRKVQGIQIKPQHMPAPMKLGRAWDLFIRHQYDGTEYTDKVKQLQLSPEQLAKLSALMRAYDDLEIQIDTENLLGCQYKVSVPVGENQIIGVIDICHEDHIREIKLSARPDFYSHKENIEYQASTYLMANEAWEYVDVEITRLPALKTGWGKYSDESSEQYEERAYSDIIGRPAHYFIGWDRKARTYGVRFWRSEFDLDEMFRVYVMVLEELKNTLKRGSWYGNKLSCFVPAICMYHPICKTGVISEEIFERRQPKIEGGDESVVK